MKTYYVITQKQKSKGFLKSFEGSYSYRSRESHPKPVFTKQFALALHFESVKEAEDAINSCIAETKKELESAKKIRKELRKFDKLKDDEITEVVVHAYTGVIGDLYSSRRIIEGSWHVNGQTMEDRFRINYKQSVDRYENTIDAMKWKLNFLETNLFVSEGEVELKFKDSEKCKRRWYENSSTDDNYCTNCGCSVPEAYYVSWGTRWSSVKLCQFCMEKLAEESRQYTEKADPEVKDLWEQSYFLHEFDD